MFGGGAVPMQWSYSVFVHFWFDLCVQHNIGSSRRFDGNYAIIIVWSVRAPYCRGLGPRMLYGYNLCTISRAYGTIIVIRSSRMCRDNANNLIGWCLRGYSLLFSSKSYFFNFIDLFTTSSYHLLLWCPQVSNFFLFFTFRYRDDALCWTDR